MNVELRKILILSKKHIKAVYHHAECLHDDPGNDLYDDLGQYEIMQEASKLLDRINIYLKGK